MTISASDPLISVLLPVYGGEEYLPSSIESILNQTFGNFELLLLLEFGNSKMNQETCQRYSQQDPRVKIIRNEKREGLARSLNIGIRSSRGEFIARMDGDDLALPFRFERQLKFLETHPGIAFCGSYVDTFGAAENHWRFFCRPATVKAGLLFHSVFAHPAVMWRRAVFVKNGLFYDETLKQSEDWDLWSRASLSVQMANIPEVLLRYRVNPSGACLSAGTQMDIYNERIQHRALEQLGLDAEKSMPVLRMLSGHARARDQLSWLGLTKGCLEIFTKNLSQRQYGVLPLAYVMMWRFLKLAVQSRNPLPPPAGS